MNFRILFDDYRLPIKTYNFSKTSTEPGTKVDYEYKCFNFTNTKGKFWFIISDSGYLCINNVLNNVVLNCYSNFDNTIIDSLTVKVHALSYFDCRAYLIIK